MPFWIPLAVAAGTALAGAASKKLSADAKARAQARYAKSLEGIEKDLYGRLYAPDTRISESNLGGVQADPEAIAAQKLALRNYIDSVHEDGLTPEDEARLADIQDQQRAVEQSQREAILADARAKGMGLSGAQLGAQLGASQASASNARRFGLDVGALGQQRRREALAAVAGLGGDIRSASFGEEATRAEARDLLNRFNSNALSDRFANQLALNDRRAILRSGGKAGKLQADNTRIAGNTAAATGLIETGGKLAGKYFGGF